MWFNVQSFDEPFRIKFDIKNKKSWMPFFDKSLQKSHFESVQPERLVYSLTSDRAVQDLEKKIEVEIKGKIREWRVFRPFKQSSNYVTRTLREILQNMEKFCILKVKEPTKAEEMVKKWMQDLSAVRSTHRVSGFPINLPYTSMTSILEAVYATQAHAIPTSDVEYAIAVYIHPYPNNILSVWIYIALITKKD
jgi:coiled-coil and C2 domain-containing protein 2A